MAFSTRFSVAVHVLTLLACSEEELLTSAFMAGSVGTNEVVVRRLLGPLRDAGLVESRLGSGGGWALALKPEEIRLDRVWRAVEEGTELLARHERPNPACLVGRNIQRALDGVSCDAARAFEATLASHTVASVLAGVLEAEAGSA